jgi:hypothetical protein
MKSRSRRRWRRARAPSECVRCAACCSALERVPAAAEIGFKPRAKIHWRIVGSHADIAEIAGAVTRWIKRATPRSNECGMSSCSTDERVPWLQLMIMSETATRPAERIVRQ